MPSQVGNLLLNIGPMADGRIPPAAVEPLERVGRWLRVHSEACFGAQDRIHGKLPGITNTGFWTLHDHTAWFWLARSYPSTALLLGGVCGRLERATLLHEPSRPLTITQTKLRTIITSLPETNTEPHLGIPVLRLEFTRSPAQTFPYPIC